MSCFGFSQAVWKKDTAQLLIRMVITGMRPLGHRGFLHSVGGWANGGYGRPTSQEMLLTGLCPQCEGRQQQHLNSRFVLRIGPGDIAAGRNIIPLFSRQSPLRLLSCWESSSDFPEWVTVDMQPMSLSAPLPRCARLVPNPIGSPCATGFV